MAYVPNPVDVTQPLDSVFASTAAAEFRALKAYVQSIVSGAVLGAVTPGMIAAFAGQVAPAGWLECDGSLQLRSTYPALYAAAVAQGATTTEAIWATGFLGWFSTGDLASNFRLPDLRGMFIRGFNHGKAGATFNAGRLVGFVENPTYVADNGGTGPAIVVPYNLSAVGNADEIIAYSTAYATVGSVGNAPAALNAKTVRPINVALSYYVKT